MLRSSMDDRLEKEFGLTTHRVTQIAIVILENLPTRPGRVELHRFSHCTAKLSTRARDFLSRQRPPDLGLEHVRLLQ